MELTQKKIHSNYPDYNVGVVISDPSHQSPNINEFAFLISDPQNSTIKHGQYCITPSNEGLIIGIINEIQVSNAYFQNAQTVKNFNNANVDLKNFFPSTQWECHIARVSILGLIPGIYNYSPNLDCTFFSKLDNVGFPATPGNKVLNISSKHLKSLIGLDEKGLNIGMLKNYSIPVNLDLNRLFSKHLAILAQSGAGKSYLVGVLLEELLLRSENLGSPAMILLDVHGEYNFKINNLKQDGLDDNNYETGGKIKVNGLRDISKNIQRFNGSFLQIGVPSLSEFDFKLFQPKISQAQLRELRKAIKICKYKKNKEKDNETTIRRNLYDIKDLINVIETELEINSNVKEALISWLEDLDYLKIFGKQTRPSIQELAKINQLTILDFNSIISQRKKSIFVHYFSSQLFYFRRQKKIPPFLLFLEEAHNFIPSIESKYAYAKPILETIAREGRKFFAQLILVSQRPVKLSTTVLSQCNSQIIMRITNPYDLQHIKESSEHLTSNAIHRITTLPTGNALILGRTINFPIFLQVRERFCLMTEQTKSLSDLVEKYKISIPMSDSSVPNNHVNGLTKIHFIQEDFVESDQYD